MGKYEDHVAREVKKVFAQSEQRRRIAITKKNTYVRRDGDKAQAEKKQMRETRDFERNWRYEFYWPVSSLNSVERSFCV